MIKVSAVGRLCKDAETFTYGAGKVGINFDLACNSYGRDEATYIRCKIFNREGLAPHLKMGDQVIINGDLEIRNVDGNYYTSIIVSELEFGAKKQH